MAAKTIDHSSTNQGPRPSWRMMRGTSGEAGEREDLDGARHLRQEEQEDHREGDEEVEPPARRPPPSATTATAAAPATGSPPRAAPRPEARPRIRPLAPGRGEDDEDRGEAPGHQRGALVPAKVEREVDAEGAPRPRGALGASGWPGPRRAMATIPASPRFTARCAPSRAPKYRPFRAFRAESRMPRIAPHPSRHEGEGRPASRRVDNRASAPSRSGRASRMGAELPFRVVRVDRHGAERRRGTPRDGPPGTTGD